MATAHHPQGGLWASDIPSQKYHSIHAKGGSVDDIVEYVKET